MNVTISFEVGYEDKDDLFAWLNAGMNGVPVKKKRKRKPMTDAEKKAFRERMVKGEEEAAKRREEIESLLEGNADQVVKAVSEITDPDMLHEMSEVEVDGKNRKTVLEAIEPRIQQLEEDAEA